MTVRTAIDVEDLVGWTYQVQCADLVVGLGIGLFEGEAYVDGVGAAGLRFGTHGDSCTRVRRAEILGCKVDGGGFNPGALHPDAEAVHDAVMELIVTDRGAGRLVLEFGISGCQPNWREGCRPRWEPCETRQKPNGEVVPVYAYNPKYRSGNHQWVCWMRLVDGPESIDFARRVYDNWRGGLVTLADALTANRNRLCAHTVTGPAVADQPWKAQETTV